MRHTAHTFGVDPDNRKQPHSVSLDTVDDTVHTYGST
jgi:hypothetical protein